MQIPVLLLVSIFAAVEAPWLYVIALGALITWQVVKEPAIS